MAKSDKSSFLNFQVDHMTMLLKPEMYNYSYILYRTIFGVPKENMIYNVKKEWVKGQGEQSMTFAVKVGQGAHRNEELNNVVIAVVQGTEPAKQSSHVRTMLKEHDAAVHWQHIALRTTDLLKFHRFALDRGINFITPILKDDRDDLIQVFSGEWFYPGSTSSGLFFEFVQREVTPELLKMLEEHNRESLFRDKTFLGLYEEKEREYKSGKVTPFMDPELYQAIMKRVGSKKLWEITEDDVGACEQLMLDYGKKRAKKK